MNSPPMDLYEILSAAGDVARVVSLVYVLCQALFAKKKRSDSK